MSADQAKSYAQIPLRDLPWMDAQPDDDVENYIEYFSDLGSSVAEQLQSTDSRSYLTFLKGSKDALRPFNITTRAYHKTKRNTFRFAEQKEGDRPTTVFIMLEPNHIEALKPVLGLIQWCMLFEWKQHKNKHRPVYLIADEASNIPWSGLRSLLTWGRSFGIRILFAFQNFPAFRDQHGEETLKTLQSEAEIALFMPQQRESETLDYVEKLMAEKSVMAKTHNRSRKEGFGQSGDSYAETGRPVMTRDEIRRTKKGALFIRNNKPWLVDLPSIASIAPWRKLLDINPFYGKPYLKPVKLHIHRWQRRSKRKSTSRKGQ